MTRMTRLAPLLSLIALGGLNASAQAQASEKQPRIENVSADPQVTTATFADWTLRCIRTGAGVETRRCEVMESLQIEGQTAPVAQLAIGRVEAKAPLQVTIMLPNNVSLGSGLRLSLGEKDTTPLELSWRRCLPGGCLADAPMPEPVLGRWRLAKEAGQIQFMDGTGRPVALPFSLRGLAQALDALAKG